MADEKLRFSSVCLSNGCANCGAVGVPKLSGAQLECIACSARDAKKTNKTNNKPRERSSRGPCSMRSMLYVSAKNIP